MIDSMNALGTAPFATPFAIDQGSPVFSGAGPSLPESAPLIAGTHLAWYRLDERLEPDELGEVWNGFDTVAEMMVTIRILPRSFAATSEKSTRVREYFRAVSAIHHQSVAPVQCLGLDPGTGYYLVQPQLRGARLRDYCRPRVDKQRRMPPRDTIKLLAAIARALDYVHDQGMVFGNIGPHNISVDDRGNVQLLSLGFKLLADLVTQSSPNNASPNSVRPLMAPEQLRGEQAAPKSDQYALAVVAYELLTGELPTLDGCTLFAMVSAGHLTGQVGEAISKALSNELAERFESCTAFVQAMLGEESNTRKALGTLGAAFLNERASKSKDASERKPNAGDPNQQTSSQAPRQGNEDSATEDDADSSATEPENNRSPNASVRQDVDNSRKNDIDARKPRTSVAKFEPVRRMEAHRHGVTTVAFSPDGRFVLSGGKDKDVRVRDAKNGRELRSLKGHSDRINGVAFCTDNRRVVSCSDDSMIRIWELDTGKQIRSACGHRGGVKSIGISASAQHVLSGGEDATLRLWDLESGEELQQFGGLFSRHQGAINAVALNSSGTLAVSGSLDGTVRLWNLATARQTTRLLKQKEGVNCVCFSADDQLIVAGTQHGKILVWDAESGVEKFRIDGHQRPVWSVACSPLGGRLLSAGWDGAICLWDLTSGSQLNRFTGHTSGVNSVAFSPDGRTAISGGFDGNLQFWSL